MGHFILSKGAQENISEFFAQLTHFLENLVTQGGHLVLLVLVELTHQTGSL